MSRRFDPEAAKAKRVIREITAFAKSQGVQMAVRPMAPYGYVLGLDMTDLFADVPGQGNGTRVMTRFCQLLDLHQMLGYTNPAGRRNYEFYRRFGFEWSPNGRSSTEMIRYAVEGGGS